jgi:hypothetical protein
VSDPILTPEYLHGAAENAGLNFVKDIVASHETLRSRLAEAEAMRDRADEHVEAVVEALRDREHDVQQA